MKKLITLSFALLLITGCTKTPEEKVEDLFSKGVEQVKDFKYAEADSTFEQIYDVVPSSELGVFGQAISNEASLQFYDAIRWYMLVLERTTDHEEAFEGLYNSYKSLGFYHEALETAVNFNKVWYDNAHTKYLLGEAYSNLRDYKRAESYFQQAMNSGYVHKGAAQFKLASIYAHLGLPNDASQEASAALKLNVDDPIYYDAAAEYYETIGYIDSSMIFNNKLFASAENDMRLVYAAFSRAVRNNYLADARSMKKSLENDGAPSMLTLMLDFDYYFQIDNKSLLSASVLKYRMENTQSLTGIMHELITTNEYKERQTIRNMMKVIKSERANGNYSEKFGSFFHYAVVMLDIHYEKNQVTIQYFDEVTGLRRNYLDFKLEYALNLHIIGYFDECYSLLENYKNGHKNDASWLTGIAKVYGDPGVRQYDKAEENFQSALKVDPNYIPAFEGYLELLVRIDKPDKALELFKTYPQFENSYKDIALEKSKYFFLNKKYTEGVNQFTSYIRYNPGNIHFAEEQINFLEKHDKSSEITQLVSVLNTENNDAKILLAEDAQRKKDYDRSLQILDELLQDEPRNHDALALKARGLYYTGKKTEAYDLFEENKKEFGNYPRNLLYYSHVLADEGFDFDKASNLARIALYEGFGTYTYLINLADIYYKMGRYDLCRGEALKATIAEKENPYPFYRLGMACANSKKDEQWFAQTKEHLQKAISLGLSGDNLQEAQNILKSL